MNVMYDCDTSTGEFVRLPACIPPILCETSRSAILASAGSHEFNTVMLNTFVTPTDASRQSSRDIIIGNTEQSGPGRT